MATDVSSFKDAYRKAIESDFPDEAALVLGGKSYPLKKVSISLRYGTNPHQPFTAYAPAWGAPLSVGGIEILKGGKEGLKALFPAFQYLDSADRERSAPCRSVGGKGLMGVCPVSKRDGNLFQRITFTAENKSGFIREIALNRFSIRVFK